MNICTEIGPAKKKGKYRNPYARNKISLMFREHGLTQELVRLMFDYDPDTGIVTRKESRGISKKGAVIGVDNQQGYLGVTICQRPHRLHRVIWLWFHGYWPENEIDHINGVRDDNRISNLREVSHSCNVRNSCNYITNTTGVKGLSWNRRAQAYIVRIHLQGDSRFIGYHEDFTEAVCHRYAAEQCLDWHSCDSDSPAYQYLKEQGILK